MKKAAVIGSTYCLGGIYSLCPISENYDILVVNYLSNATLANSALGLDTPIIRSLLLEKPVVVLNDGVQYRKITNINLLKTYDGYAEKLKSFGVSFADCIPNESSHCKTLITAKDVSVCRIGKIEVSKNAIVTPAAYDLAKEKNINIVRNELL